MTVRRRVVDVLAVSDANEVRDFDGVKGAAIIARKNTAAEKGAIQFLKIVQTHRFELFVYILLEPWHGKLAGALKPQPCGFGFPAEWRRDGRLQPCEDGALIIRGGDTVYSRAILKDPQMTSLASRRRDADASGRDDPSWRDRPVWIRRDS